MEVPLNLSILFLFMRGNSICTSLGHSLYSVLIHHMLGRETYLVGDSGVSINSQHTEHLLLPSRLPAEGMDAAGR